LQKSTEHAQDLKQRGSQCLEQIEVASHNLNAGWMRIRFLPEFSQTGKTDPQAAAYALARVTGVISPQESSVEPTLIPQNRLNGILLGIKAKKADVTTQQTWLSKDCQSSTLRGTWRVSRPPLRSEELKRTTTTFTPAASTSSKTGVWSEWILWDRRYWLRVRTNNAQTLARIGVRCYQSSHTDAMRKQLGPGGFNILLKLLKDNAPGTTRFTLPVLTVDGKIVLFPSLINQNSPARKLFIDDNPPGLRLEWEISYKVNLHESGSGIKRTRDSCVRHSGYLPTVPLRSIFGSSSSSVRDLKMKRHSLR
jgi:hypothetical protein